jgi:L-alanine-DL-glutamate epimerase-like enolase superfamily enzyme
LRISNLKIHFYEPLKVRSYASGTPKYLPSTVGMVRLSTDEGIEGNFAVWPEGAAELLRSFAADKDELIGADPFDRERIWKRLAGRWWSNHAICAVDMCLWDIAGKAVNKPVYKLLGGYRDKILGYASTLHLSSDEEYIDLVQLLKEQGYKAIKIHPYMDWRKDIILYRKVREAVGENMILAADPYAAYDREGALKVGRVLDELNYAWFEDPLPVTDLDGLAELCSALDTAILEGELIRNYQGYTELIRRQAADALRAAEFWVGGLTPMLKLAHLADCFGMKFEPHSWGNAIICAASLQLMLGIKNSDYCEISVPERVFDNPGFFQE